MTKAKAHAICASAYNRHVATGGVPMTPSMAATLSRGDKAALCRIAEAKGLDICTAAEAAAAFAAVVS